MATTSVDLLVRVVGGSKLDKLERQLKGIDKTSEETVQSLSMFERKLANLQTTGLDKVSVKIRKLKADVIALRKQSKRIISDDAFGDTSNAAGGGAASAPGGGLAAIGGLIGGLNAFANIQERTNKAIERQTELLKLSGSFAEELAANTRKFEQASEKAASTEARIAKNSEIIELNTKQRADLLEEIDALQKKIKANSFEDAASKKIAKNALAQMKVDAGEYQRQITKATRSSRQLEGSLERQRDDLAAIGLEYDGIEASVKRTAGRQVGRGQALGAIGAGLAFSNIPGQGSIQAAGAGALAGGGAGGAAIAVGTKAVADITAQLVRLQERTIETRREIALFEEALQNVAVGSDYQQALSAVARSVEDFNSPLTDTTRNFTQLLAATQSANFTVGETEKVFRALSAANTVLG
ncbi:MAG: hypothetical protein VWZ99_05325, partial [Aquiluna sp.]